MAAFLSFLFILFLLPELPELQTCIRKAYRVPQFYLQARKEKRKRHKKQEKLFYLQARKYKRKRDKKQEKLIFLEFKVFYSSLSRRGRGVK
jgi:hypothetical protein